MAIIAIIFDVDGTLVDTNAAHVAAWQQAFEKSGFDVLAERIAPEIGKGGDQLVPAVLNEQAEKQHGEALRDAYGNAFLEITAREKFVVFPGVRELLQTLRERDLKTALATSADRKYFEALQKSAGIGLEPLVDLTTTADDAAKSKPAPDLLLATCEKLKLAPQQCALVGDTPHDGEAARRAGVAFIGVESGGHTSATLSQADARSVWRDTADLLAHLDEALQSVSA